eukprot:TRINITY_DN4820_c0_g1_i4.p1 TRINITY_DN4820_c0_g1~~TRINITY_DN4820_c0_g1_i4.p1  ORF type:complete len:900 (+),score=249.28 TRINITY_DN4820_c0_g1_i4:97-2700(+)
MASWSPAQDWKSAQVPASGQLGSLPDKRAGPAASSPSSSQDRPLPLSCALSSLAQSQRLGSVVVERNPSCERTENSEDAVARADIYARLRRIEDSFCKEQEMRREAEGRVKALEKQVAGLQGSSCSSDRVDAIQRLLEEDRTSRQASGEVESLIHGEVQRGLREALPRLQDAVERSLAPRFDSLSSTIAESTLNLSRRGVETEVDQNELVRKATASCVQKVELELMSQRLDTLQDNVTALQTKARAAEVDRERLTDLCTERLTASQVATRIEVAVDTRLAEVRAEWRRLLEETREEGRSAAEEQRQALARSLCEEMEKSVVTQAVAEARAEARVLLAGELETLCRHLSERTEDSKAVVAGESAKLLLLDQQFKSLEEQVKTMASQQHKEAAAKLQRDRSAKDDADDTKETLSRLATLVHSRLDGVERTLQAVGQEVLSSSAAVDRMSVSMPNVPQVKSGEVMRRVDSKAAAAKPFAAAAAVRPSSAVAPAPQEKPMARAGSLQALPLPFAQPLKAVVASLEKVAETVAAKAQSQASSEEKKSTTILRSELAPAAAVRSKSAYARSSTSSEDGESFLELTAREESIRVRERRLQQIEDSLRTCGVEFTGKPMGEEKATTTSLQRRSEGRPAEAKGQSVQKRRSQQARSLSPTGTNARDEERPTNGTLLGHLRTLATSGGAPHCQDSEKGSSTYGGSLSMSCASLPLKPLLPQQEVVAAVADLASPVLSPTNIVLSPSCAEYRQDLGGVASPGVPALAAADIYGDQHGSFAMAPPRMFEPVRGGKAAVPPQVVRQCSTGTGPSFVAMQPGMAGPAAVGRRRSTGGHLSPVRQALQPQPVQATAAAVRGGVQAAPVRVPQFVPCRQGRVR